MFIESCYQPPLAAHQPLIVNGNLPKHQCEEKSTSTLAMLVGKLSCCRKVIPFLYFKFIFSYNFHKFRTICPEFSYNLPTVFLQFSYIFPTIFLQFSYNFPTIFLKFFLQFSYSFPTIFIQCSYYFPTVFLLFSYHFLIALLEFSYNLPIVFLQFSYNVPTIFLQFTYSFPTVFLLFSFNFPIVFLQFSYNFLMLFPYMYIYIIIDSRTFCCDLSYLGFTHFCRKVIQKNLCLQESYTFSWHCKSDGEKSIGAQG